MKRFPNIAIQVNLIYLVFTFLLITALHTACTADKLPEVINDLPCKDDNVVYINQIKPLIDTYCAIPDCHDSGSSLGDYTDFNGMQSAGILNDSGFKNRVLERADGDFSKMPPPYSTGPTSIQTSDLELIQCWINQGYLEN